MKLVLFVACVLAGCGAKTSGAPATGGGVTPEPIVAPGPTTPATPEPSGTTCPEGQRYDECAHGSCPTCDDCVAECVPL